MDQIINKILKSKTECFFVSPHLDDAALSAGGLISHLTKHGVPVTVINVFTSCGSVDSETLSARRFVNLSGCSNSNQLYQDRIKEDKQALKLLGAKVINLGFVDALWRQKPNQSSLVRFISKFIPEFGHIYPTYRFHIQSGIVSNYEQKLLKEISDNLAQLGVNEAKFVFGPYGNGRHVDHVLTRLVVERCTKCMYWFDQPYAYRDKTNPTTQFGPSIEVHAFRPDFEAKNRAINCYRTQINSLFSEGKTPNLDEYFLIFK